MVYEGYRARTLDIDHLIEVDDAVALVHSGRLAVTALGVAYSEILPRVPTEGVGTMDPERFASQYALLKSRLASPTE